MLLSACNQPVNSLAQKSTELEKQTLAISSPYGRKAKFSYPDFSGEFTVATQTVLLTDPSRLETFDSGYSSNQLDANRTIQVRFFYPSQRFSYAEKNGSLAEQKTGQLPVVAPDTWDYLIGHQKSQGKRLRFDNYQDVKWDIDIDQPVNPKRASYPILVFSHGYGYNAEAYSALSAELASRGFIVASINHTYGANPVDLGQRGLIWATALKKGSVGSYLPVWSDDQMLVVEYLGYKNSDSSDPFFQKLDLANIGIFGHSYGGAAAFRSASREPRIKAIMDIDGTLFNDENEQVTQPFAMLLSEDHHPTINFDNISGPSYLIRLNNFTHASFSDHILWWQWDHDELDLGFGTVNAYRAIELTTDIVDEFFSHYLIGKTSTLFEVDHIDTPELSLVKK